jgi:hypothetical protein
MPISETCHERPRRLLVSGSYDPDLPVLLRTHRCTSAEGTSAVPIRDSGPDAVPGARKGQGAPLPSRARPDRVQDRVQLGQCRVTSRLKLRHAQGIPFKSGARSNCFGNPPAMHINAVTSTPAHPPPMNAAKIHQNESIRPPLSTTSNQTSGLPTLTLRGGRGCDNQPESETVVGRPLTIAGICI